MPRYAYQCHDCQHSEVHFHSFSGSIGECPSCSSSVYMKQVSRPSYATTKTEQEEKTGNLTKRYIEDNRELLKDMKKESSGESYEPS